MEEIKDTEHVRPEYPQRKAGRQRQKLTGEELKQHLKELQAKRNKRYKAKLVSGSLANNEAAAKFKESRKRSWLALQAKKQTAQLLEDAAKQDIRNETLKVKKRLMKIDDRMLEIANDVDKMVYMLRDMKVQLDRSYDLASKASKKAHQQDRHVV